MSAPKIDAFVDPEVGKIAPIQEGLQSARARQEVSIGHTGFLRAAPLAVLALGHTLCDFYATYLTPLLPVLADKFHLSTFLCSALVAAVGISGSTLQPLVGAIGGAGDGKMVIGGGMAMMAVFFGCLGLAPNVVILFLLLVVGALGCSLFHPHAATIATRLSGGRRGLAMSFFTVAGTAGIFLSPKIIPRIVTQWGLEALILTAPLGLLYVGVLFLTPMNASRNELPAAPTEWRGLLSSDLRALSFLVLSAILYSVTICGICAFMPLMLCRERGYTLTAAGDLLAWLILAGAMGVMIGGYLSDRIGRWSVIMTAYLMSVPLFWGFLMSDGAVAQALLMLGGLTLWAAQPCTITLAQELMPKASRIASGLVMGFAWGMAGLFLPIFGLIADHAGTAYAMQWIALLPVGAAFSLWLMKRTTHNLGFNI